VEIEVGFGMTAFGIATAYIGLTIAFGKADVRLRRKPVRSVLRDCGAAKKIIAKIIVEAHSNDVVGDA
jgi:hypothetical protein